jgi:hypothetical protein
MIIMKKLFSLSLILLFLMSCNKDDNGYRELDMAMVKLNIADAEILVLCGNETKTKSNQQGSDLFKIDKNGEMSAVFWVVPGTTDTLSIVPNLILPLSAEYVLFSGIEVACNNPDSHYFINSYGDSYVIRKKDGEVFKIDGYKYPDFQNLCHAYYYADDKDLNPRTDKLNNAYCLASDNSSFGSVYKFALGSLSDITMQKVNLDQFPIPINSWYTHPFEVDFKGNCITFVKDDRVILYKAEGGLYEFPQEENVFDYFVGYNGDLYCCSSLNGDSQNNEYKIYPLEVGVQVLYDFENAVSKTTQTRYSGSKSSIFTLENKYIHVLLATDDTNNMLVYNSKEETIKEVGFTPGTLEEVVGVSNNSIYRIMDNKIYKYDFVSDEKDITPIDFDFSSCTVYKKWSAYNVPNGSKFILGAIRNSDMAKLRIEVDMESGKATVFEDMQDRPIVTLVQIR